jgi:hypothetical protein
MREEEGERQQRVTSNGDQDRNDDKGDEGLEGDDGTEEDGRMVYESDDASADTWEIDEDVEELDENERFTRGGDLGVVQEWDDRDRENTGEQAVLAKIALDREYRRNFLADSSQKRWHDKCRNRHELCTAWALEGECGRNFAFMKTGCPVACRSCDWLDVEERCRPDPDESDSLIPGDLDRLFERIASDPEIQRRFQPVVLSRPSYALGDDAESASYQIGMWLVLLKTFLSEEEARRMVGLTERSGLQPSEGGEVSRDGDYISSVSDYRTSWNTVRFLANVPRYLSCFTVTDVLALPWTSPPASNIPLPRAQYLTCDHISSAPASAWRTRHTRTWSLAPSFCSG